ncbi:MAG: translocation/assembly module TamB domain-containing protein [Gemmatimonadetes bacterium]|nr:translocation/assembly module TamB domain-containing protein [Gemmatimonadota bacterium]
MGWILICLVGLVALAALVAGLLLRTDWVHERVRLFALERLRAAVQGEVDVARIGGDLLRGIRLEGVAIRGRNGEPFLNVERLEVDYTAGGFLGQRILLGDVVLVRPRITLVQDSLGQWNYLRILPFLRGSEKPRDPGGWGSVVRVERLRIVDGALAVTTEREARTFGPLGAGPELTGLNGSIHLDISPASDGDRKRFAAEDLAFELREPSLSVRELDARAAFTPRGLAVDRFLLRTGASEVAGRGSVRNLARPVFDLGLDVTPLSLAELRRFVPGVPFEGTVRGSLGLVGPLADPELSLENVVLRTPGSVITVRGRVTTEKGPVIDARIALEPLAPADVRVLWGGWPLNEPVRGNLQVRGSLDRMVVDGPLTFGETVSQVSGSLGLAGPEPSYDMRIAARGLDLQDILHEEAWSSVVNGEFRISGRGLGTSARAAFGGTLRDTRVLFYDFRSGAFSGRFRPGAFEVDSFTVALPQSRIWGSGILPYDYSLALDLRAVSRNLQDFYPGVGPMPAARFEGRGKLAGPFSGIDLEMTASAESLAWNGLVASRFEGTGAFLHLGRPEFRMAIDGTGSDVDYLGPIRFGTAEFHAGFEGDTMGVTVAVQMDSLRSGDGHLDIDFAGEAPRVVLDRGTLQVDGRPFAVQEPSGFAYQAGEFRFDDFALANDRQRIALDGTLRVDGVQDFGFTLQNVALETLQAFGGARPVAEGIFNGSGRVTGTDLEPVIQGAFDLSEGRLAGLEVHRLEGRVDYAGRSLGLDVRLQPETLGADSLGDHGSIALRGRLPVDLAFGSVPPRFPDAPMDLRMESEGLSLALVQAFNPRLRTASGPLRFDLRLAGRPSAPTLEGRFELQEGRIGSLAIHEAQGTIGYEDREIELDLTLAPETESADREEDPGSLAVRGTFPVDLALTGVERRIPDRPMDLRLESRDLSLELLESFFPRITAAAGPVAIDVHLAGSPSRPEYGGAITLTNGRLRVGDGALYSRIGGAVRFDNDQVTFEDVRVSSATGDVRLEGRIALRELALGDIQASLRARRFTLIDDGGKELIVDADVTLAGTTSQPSVTGTVNVEQLEWPLPERTDRDVIDLDEAILYVRAEGDTAAPTPTPGVWSQALIDLDVSVEDDAILRSDQALIVLEGDLSIDKSRGRDLPSIAGGLDVVRGFYSEFGAQFEIEEGEVFFYGTPELNPGLHIIAVTEVRNSADDQDVEVTLTVGGTVERPTLEVNSNPAYEKSEIFSLLLFGTPSPGQGQQGRFESTVARVASTQASLPLQRALASELGLDLLEVQPGLGSDAGRFRAGKYVANDVFVSVTQATGPRDRDTYSQFGIQYRLSRKWTIETQAGTRQVGADIFYEFQY